MIHIEGGGNTWLVSHAGELDDLCEGDGWIGTRHPVSIFDLEPVPAGKMRSHYFKVEMHEPGCQCDNDD